MATAALAGPLPAPNIAMIVTPERREAILAELRKPFTESEIRWRVAGTSRDKKKGRVVPYADKRAYTDRLTTVLNSDGWSAHYEVTTISPLQRLKKDKLITTSKVIITCKLTLHGIGEKESTGEEWADDENCGTRAEAQAFKRACSEFGLGRYFYGTPEFWVDLDQDGQPKRLPKLTNTAASHQNPTQRNAPAAQQRPQSAPSKGQQSAASAQRRPATQQRPAPQQQRALQPASQRQAQQPQTAQQRSSVTVLLPASIESAMKAKIYGYNATLGAPLYCDIVRNLTEKFGAGEMQGDIGPTILAYMENALKKLDQIQDLARQIPDENVFYGILDQHGVENLGAVPGYNTLLVMHKSMSEALGTHAA